MKRDVVAEAKAIISKSRKYLPVEGFTPEETEALSVAYLKGELGYVQVAKVLKKNGSSVYSVISASLRRAYQKGVIR